MKKSMKLVVILLLAVTLVMSVPSMVSAESKASAASKSEEKNPVSSIVNTDNYNGSTANELKSVGNGIVGIVKIVGIFVAVIALMIVAIRYMMGSAEEKAEYKKVLVPYVLGAVLLFGASLFADKIANVITSMLKAQ